MIEAIKKFCKKVKEKYNAVMETKFGKTILRPLVIVIGLILSVFTLIGSMFLIFKPGEPDKPETDPNEGFDPDVKVINEEIEAIKDRIQKVDSEILRNNYRNLTKEEAEVYEKVNNPETVGKMSKEDKEKAIEVMKKIENVRTPQDSIDDMEGLI